ncbi:MAG: HAD family hydrolase [Chloroflexota bacterium]|nr:HAD family phosphatase [Chloroflexota bacterium]
MRYRLLALDIDGTLLDPEGEIRPRVRQAIQRAVEAGCLVTLATGRRLHSAREVANELGLQMPLILYIGSLIYDTLTEKALFYQPMPSHFLRQALTLVREAGLCPTISQSPLRGEYIYLGPSEDDDLYTRKYSEHKSRVAMIRRLSYDELALLKDALLISVTGPSKLLPLLTEVLRGRMECNLYNYALRHKTMADLYGFDLVQPGVSKGHALLWLAAHFGIAATEL